MTNTYVQPGGWAYARENGLTILDRNEGLGDWMNQARRNLSPEAVNGTPGQLRPETRVTLGIVCCAAIAVLVVVISALIGSPRQAIAAAPPAARATPVAATSASPGSTYSGMISGNRTPSPVSPTTATPAARATPLGASSASPCPDQNRNFSGYKDTIRDVLTEIHARGNTVTGRF